MDDAIAAQTTQRAVMSPSRFSETSIDEANVFHELFEHIEDQSESRISQFFTEGGRVEFKDRNNRLFVLDGVEMDNHLKKISMHINSNKWTITCHDGGTVSINGTTVSESELKATLSKIPDDARQQMDSWYNKIGFLAYFIAFIVY